MRSPSRSISSRLWSVTLATITPPTLEPVEDEIETETALVGEDGEPLEGDELEAAKAEAAEGEESADGGDSDSSDES